MITSLQAEFLDATVRKMFIVGFVCMFAISADCEDSIPSSLTFLTIYNSTLPWSQALQICSNTGGHFPYLDTPVKSAMVTGVIRKTIKKEQDSTENITYWIGLHLGYVWGSGVSIAGNWSGWSLSLTESDRCPGSCVTSDVTGIWQTTQCRAPNYVICEFHSHENCAFEPYRGGRVRLETGNVTSLPFGQQNMTAESCGNHCLQFHSDCEECWIWSHTNGRCVFYTSCSPPILNITAMQQDEQRFTFHSKVCLNGYLNTTPIYEESLSATEIIVKTTEETTGMETMSATTVTAELPTATSERTTTATDLSTLLGEESSTTKESIYLDQTASIIGTTNDAIRDTQRPCVILKTNEIITTTEIISGIVSISQASESSTSKGDKVTEIKETSTKNDVTFKGCVCRPSTNSDVKTSTFTSQTVTQTLQSTSHSTTKRPSDEKYVEKLILSLQINVSKTSAYRRRLTSADDDRPSAKSVGYVGVALLCAFAGVIVCFDAELAIKKLASIILSNE